MESIVKTYSVAPEDRGVRLDIFLVRHNPLLTRSYLKRIIESENVKLNAKIPKAGERLKPGDRIELILPPPEPMRALAEPIPLTILYEDPEIIVVNKPAGLVVHPAGGNYSGTLVNGLLYHCQDLSSLGAPFRPGIVHRLDKNTTGVMVVAKTDYAHQRLAAQFKTHTVIKKYLALTIGVMKDEKGTLTSLIGRHPKERKKMSAWSKRGKAAITHWEVLKRFRFFTLLTVNLETGRTHQIRVHLASIHHPVLGDSEYGGRKPLGAIPIVESERILSLVKRQLLHAATLGFIHPRKEGYVEFNAPLPEDLQTVLEELEEHGI